MALTRVLLLLLAAALGVGPGRAARAPSLAGHGVVRLVADPAGEPAHPAASARLPAAGLAARPPTSGHGGDGRPAAVTPVPAARHGEPLTVLASLALRPAGWRSAPARPPYYPNAPPALSRILSII
jgi:hypothetical protein